MFWEQSPNGRRMNLADSNFNDFRTLNHTLSGLVAYEELLLSVSGGSEPVRINIGEVSRGFFQVLAVEPSRGRAFAPEEQRLHGMPAAIVSYRYWQ